MVFDSASTFELLRQCQKTGLLEDLVAVAGRALDNLVDETGLGMGDLLGLLDSVPEEAVLKAEDRAAELDAGELVSRLAINLDGGDSRDRLAAMLTESLKRAVEAAQGRAEGV